jgi:hypothetical protein
MLQPKDIQRAAQQVIKDHGASAAETAARWALMLRSANYADLAQTWERIAIAIRAIESAPPVGGRLTRLLRFG